MEKACFCARAIVDKQRVMHNSGLTLGATMVSLLTWFIRSYQTISRSLPLRACRFHPSCSQYALEAIQKHGAWKGFWIAVGRVTRCSPFNPGGYDPVR
jgi:putative membrane protein insertion efficiency factor